MGSFIETGGLHSNKVSNLRAKDHSNYDVIVYLALNLTAHLHET